MWRGLKSDGALFAIRGGPSDGFGHIGVDFFDQKSAGVKASGDGDDDDVVGKVGVFRSSMAPRASAGSLVGMVESVGLACDQIQRLPMLVDEGRDGVFVAIEASGRGHGKYAWDKARKHAL